MITRTPRDLTVMLALAFGVMLTAVLFTDAWHIEQQRAAAQRTWRPWIVLSGGLFLTCFVSLYLRERQRTERQLREQRAHLAQTEKVAAVGQLAAGAAHEIGNPLAVISGEAQMLLKAERDLETKEAAQTIIEQVTRIKDITERLLHFSKKRDIHWEPLDVKEVVEQSLALVSHQTEMQRLTVVKALASGLSQALGDRHQLQEACVNIMLNAVQAMPHGGRLTLKTSQDTVRSHGRRRTDPFRLGDQVVVIEITDTGVGMSEETLSKLFVPFFTTKAQGTGLGLPVCRGIIESHHGVIEVRSVLGEGSTVTITLPVPKKVRRT